MENNVEVAVRVCPIFYDTENELCVSPNIYNNSVHLCNSINSHVFPVNYALPLDCNQNALFATTVTPLLNYFLEGCDVSVVGYGQAGSGKSYTLLGPALSCALSECEYGIIPRFLRELFGLVSQKKDKNYVVHVTWSQICGENVQDLLGVGSVQCGNVGQAFEVLQLGMSNLTSQSVHTLFTVTLEQNWVVDAVVQHKISTASFVDLASSKTMYLMNNTGITETVLSDPGLNMLQKCVWALSESGVAPYNQSALTMLLKDSFGGRAKTLVICCVTPLFSDFMETFYTLEFARRSQMVKNFVTINSYTTYENSCDNTDVFGLQFAANQLLQLVSNAESLFNNLILNGSLTKSQMQQISKWLTLKQECDDCISETSEHPRSLDIIKEEMEGSQDNSSSEESECVEQEETQNMQQLEDLMQSFKSKTDGLVSENNRKHVKVVKTKSNESSYNEFHAKGARGRRPSIHNQNEKMSPLHLISSKNTDDSLTNTKSNTKVSELSYEGKLKMLQQTCDEIARCESQINQLELTVATKEKFVQQLLTYKSQNSSTRDKLKKNYNKLRTEESKARSKLMHAKSVNDQEMERKYYGEVCRITQKLSESEFIKDVTKDDVKKIGELESSLNNSKKELQQLKKQKEKEEKQKQSFEIELDRCKRSTDSDVGSKKNNLSLVLATRSIGTESSEIFKYDIKELRKTRDLLLQQRYSMDAKANKKLLHESEELKIFRCEEAIEIMDLSIEYKNQLLCGTIVVLDESILDKHENVEKILIEQLLKFNTNEIRVLLKRYFEKVIDLRSSTKRLEYQLSEMEVQNENLLYRIQNLTHALQRVRLESERRIVSLKQQHEDKLQLVIRRFIPDDNDEDGSERVMSRVVKTSKQAALAFQVAQTSNGKQMDKKSLIAKVTRYARHEIVPRQLQAAITQATVTRQKNKLIIQQSNK